MGTICSSSGSQENIKTNDQPVSRPTSLKSANQDRRHVVPTTSEQDSAEAGTTTTTAAPAAAGPPPPSAVQPDSDLGPRPESQPGSAGTVPAAGTPPGPEDPQLAAVEGLPPDVARRVCGRLHDLPHTAIDDKVVRVYHTALLTDCHEERDVLYERVYPKLQTWCLERGHDLHVVDLHWGLSDDGPTRGGRRSATYRQQLADLIRRDDQVIVVVFLNDKYGCYGCPARVAKVDMDEVIDRASDVDRDLLNTWYDVDENNVPPTYYLQPISAHITGYDGNSLDDHRQARSHWEETRDKLSATFWQNSEQEFQTKYLVSSLEEELEESVFSGKVPAENVVWLRRSFLKMDAGSKLSVLSKFTDIIHGKPDEVARTKLNNLTNRLNDKVEQVNKIDLEVPWHDGRLDQGTKEHAKYLTELCGKYEEIMRSVMDHVMDVKATYDRVRVSMAGAGLERGLYDEILHHTARCQSLCGHVVGQDQTVGLLTNYVTGGHPTSASQPVPGRPLVVTGVAGSGKSTLAAVVATNSCSLHGWTRSVCVFRHVGATADSLTLDQVLSSIASQICFLYNLPYSYAHKPASFYPIAFAKLLDRVPESTPLLVIIDGLDLLQQHEDISWIPRTLHEHVRLIVTVTEGTKARTMLKKLSGEEEGFVINVPDLDPNNAVEILDNILDASGRRLTNKQRVAVETAVRDSPTPLFASVLAECTSRWSSTMDDLNLVPAKATIKKLMDAALLSNLEKHYGEECIQRLLGYIGCTRCGISDMEMDDLLSCDEGVLPFLYPYEQPAVRRAPCVFWLDVKSYLGPLLLERTVGGSRLTTWRHKALEDIVKERCQPYEAMTKVKFLDYFEGRWSNGKLMQFSSKDEGIDQLTDRLVRPQPTKFGNFYNRRKIDELPYCFVQNDMLERLQKEFLLNADNLTHKISTSGLYNVLHDFCFCMTTEEVSGDIQFLYDVLRQLAPLLSQEGCHLWPQIILRVRSGKLVLDQTSCSEVHRIHTSLTSDSGSPSCQAFLIPSDFSVLDLRQPDADRPEPYLQGLFHVGSDENHVTSVCPVKGEVTVWNIHHQEAVRCLRGLPEPKDIRMIDSARAVILCGRELRVFNLDEGTENRRLKGVLNLKMPFFGVLDDDHTVALSRNRMYVNIIKNDTGDVEATFKVGEDRFLDSLLVSANGEKCVCGDQVQKPFPLLVWDLNNRKLVHDLRIAGHEFLTRMSAITNEGHYVVCVCQSFENAEPNFLIVYDLLSGTLFKKWKPSFNTTSVAISSASSLVVSGHEDGTIIAWDLVGGAQRWTLSGHSRGPNHIRMSDDGGRAVSCDLSGRDTSVWLWDVLNGECLGCFTTEFGVSCCEISPDGAAVVIGVPGSEKMVTLWPTENDRNRSRMDISIYGDASRSKRTFDLDQ